MEKIMTFRKITRGILALVVVFCAYRSEAGVALGATRVIYPGSQKQVTLGVSNNNDKDTYLIQSWVESDNGTKEGRFVITPPLFVIQGKKENTLRIIDATNNNLPNDRESLFWVNVKAIPSLDKDKQKGNTLQLAITSRIKLLYRPRNLSIAPDQAPGKLTFKRRENLLTLNNPTPYFLTVTELNAGARILANVMVPPMGTATVKLPNDAGSAITYRTINDYGALTTVMKGVMH
ncbi:MULTISPECIES: fimbria/pilus periplasmic chaperone [unclassified Serratia (in: enterobacteria)]|uniref:fimbria/pilus periplasmic chaperone n=1 Tax=unclassified Serratia (in: enterobacteria) TaxID=2647522 RepID=UPI0027F6C327|nr:MULTISPECIES: fimbria/pilus periplasmic chaperone [unclassified Serratia (in: enterobacteria)]MDQ7099073.1 fimbria/pilus periplasmic chaperone [Serratia sp. MF2]MDQ7105579.1 fimbria/pilus periplasmic chaperone [Serratia sp. MF1(2023)]